MSHHANDGSASRIRRSLMKQHGYNNDPSGLLAALAALEQRHAQGEHEVRVAEPRRVTYVRGQQVKPGTRYCRYCGLILPPEEVSQ